MSKTMPMLLRLSTATEDAIAEAEERWRNHKPPYTLLDAIDEHKAAERLGPLDESLFDQTVDLDLRDWLDKPLADIDTTMITARYGMLWRTKQRDRARRFLRIVGALRKFAVHRHPEIDFGPDPFAYQPDGVS